MGLGDPWETVKKRADPLSQVAIAVVLDRGSLKARGVQVLCSHPWTWTQIVNKLPLQHLVSNLSFLNE
ncbi:hypothetical protein ACLOJK_025604, partial [Asimina triloba]